MELLFEKLENPKARSVLTYILSGDSITHSCVQADIGNTTFYVWLRNMPGFKEAYDEIEELSVPKLENILNICAEKSLADPRYQNSLHFMLKHRSSKYRDNSNKSILDDPGEDLDRLDSTVPETPIE